MTDTPNTPGSLTAAMLKQVFETDALVARHIDDEERFQFVSARATAFVAAEALVFLTALDPEAAARFAKQVAERLDEGDLTNWAWCHADEAGWDPQVWAEAPR
ncbi:hypothetical protein [Embleya sp. NPDC001921]